MTKMKQQRQQEQEQLEQVVPKAAHCILLVHQHYDVPC